MEGALWGLLEWKGPDPEVQDAASTADLAEGARGTEQSPVTSWALLCPALGSEHPTDPWYPQRGSSVCLQPAPQSPHRASSPLFCSPGSFGLTARWQSATTVMGKAPSGMQLRLLAGTNPATCSQLLTFSPQIIPSPPKPESLLVFLSP